MDGKFIHRLNLYETIMANTDCSRNCWLWLRSKTKRGYGKITLDGKTLYVHRVVWEALHGEIPKGMKILHHCDNPSCVNPAHLFQGTQKDNMQDMLAKGRGNKASGDKWWNNRSVEGMEKIAAHARLFKRQKGVCAEG